MLWRDDDPRSPDRGQYGFLQELLRTVAYGTLARRTRKTLHVAAAQHLEQAGPGGREEIAEVLAAHYLEAIRADPGAGDVTALRASARERSPQRATRRRRSRSVPRRSGTSSRRPSSPTAPSAPRVERASGLAQRRRRRGRHCATSATRTRSCGPKRSRELATVHIFGVDPAAAGPLLDEAVTTLEQARAWPVLATALIGQAIELSTRHRVAEGDAILRSALSLAEEHDLPAVALRARYNLAGLALDQDRLADAIREVDPGIVLARERGDRFDERILLAQSLMPLVGLGRWDEAASIGAALIAGELDVVAIWAATCCAQIAGARGDEDMLDRCRAIASHDWDSTHGDTRAPVMLLGARVALQRGASRDALALARPVLELPASPAEFLAEAFAILVEAALALPDDTPIAELEAFATALAPARATPLLRAGRARLAAERAQRRGDAAAAEDHETEAIELLRAIGARPLLAQALNERSRRRDDRDARAEARRLYTELGATRRLAHVGKPAGVVARGDGGVRAGR